MPFLQSGVDYYPIYGYNNIKQIEPYMRALYARDGKYLKKENFQEAIMKKFSIKSLLVLVLALVLAVSLVLVACNKKDDGGKGNGGGEEVQGYTAGEYFTKLWDLSKSIGNETIAANQNIAVSADLVWNLQSSPPSTML